ncbi:MAG: linear amide C-N hydrolase [Bacillota bacterium]|nr:linear amide C-N hydrolase [Bacillota bacterium]
MISKTYGNTVKKLAFLAIIAAACFVFSTNIYACTIFAKQQGDRVLVGNNEDYFYSINSSMTVEATAEGSYGRVVFSNSTYVQGGMNEKGLFYDGAACPPTEIPSFKNKPTLGMNFGDEILAKCSNVDEAVGFLKKYNIPQKFGDHLLIADETGKSVIVEWVQNEMKVIQKEKDYQIATNFFISNPDLGGYPCQRFNTVDTMLKGDANVSVDSFKKILSATSQDWGDGGTKYTNIYDLKSKLVYVFNKADFSKAASINLTRELEKLKPGEKVNYGIEELDYEKFEDNSHNPAVAGSIRVGQSSEANTVNAENEAKADEAKPNFKGKIDFNTKAAGNGSSLIWWVVIPGILTIGGVSIFLLKHRGKHTMKSE